MKYIYVNIYILFFIFVSKFFMCFDFWINNNYEILSKGICCISKLIAIKEIEWGVNEDDLGR